MSEENNHDMTEDEDVADVLNNHFGDGDDDSDEKNSEQEQEKDSDMSSDELGRGLDIGTMNLVSARKVGSSVRTKRIRDAFLDLEQEAKKMLKMSGVSYVEKDDQIVILGDPALETANLFQREARRPLKGGLISSKEMDALEILSILIENVLGEPSVDGEICYYGIPANPIDNPDHDVTYHEAVFERLVSELGYKAVSGNEAMAIVYSECASDGFSGIGCSFGAGMTNIALSYMTMPIMEFSVQRGGDWIDERAAQAVGSTASRMCSIKEKGIDLMEPEGREEEALVVYYRNLINYALKKIAKQFKEAQSDATMDKAIPIVVSGGTSLAGGFVELFEDVFDDHRADFPIDISEIREAEDPMTAVAEGLLVQARSDYSD